MTATTPLREQQSIAVPEDATRREFIVGVGSAALAAAFLAACGDDNPEEAPERTTTAATRRVDHAFGTSEIPADPQRIVVVGRRGTLPVLLDLGLEPIAALDATSFLGQPFHPLIADRTDALDLDSIARDSSGPDLEQVAALEPDLIIGAAGDFADVVPQLSEIAPVVGIDWDYVEPLANVQAVGDVLGLGAEAAALIGEFEGEVATIAARLDDPGTVSIMGLFAPDDVRVFRSGNFIGHLVEQLGGQIVPTEEELPLDAENLIFNRVSLEQLDILSGERLISFVNLNADQQATYRGLAAEPNVQALPAFRSGQVLEVDPQLPYGTAGIAGLREVLRQLETFFSG